MLPWLPMIGRGAELGTRQQTITPVAVDACAPQILPSDVAHYGADGYSAWQWGPGEDAGRQFLTPAESTSAPNAARLLSFFSISDVHITDKESPGQVPYFGWSAPYNGWRAPFTPAPALFSQAYSPVMLSTTQVLDAAVKTINATHRLSPFDFGICLGDAANSTQYNELRWFIDVMDGRYITPSSGAHLGAANVDYQMPFQAAGLDRSIPWYQVIGNHDQMWMGVHYPTDKIRATLVGSNVLNMYSNVFYPNSTELTGEYMGVVDGSAPNGGVIGGGVTNDFSDPPTVAADPDRRSLTTVFSSTTNFMSEFFNTRSLPIGHGFTAANIASNSACYTFMPMTNLPVKVIVLDDTCKTAIPDTYLESLLEPALGQTIAQLLSSVYAGYGWMDAPRVAWLTNELQKGQDSNQLMILACHIPINPQADIGKTNAVGQFFPPNYQTETNLLATLHRYPNLMLLMAGHRHLNIVTPQPSPDPAHPELGFWEVETPSLRDFPRQFRAWEILRNRDNSISIKTTDVDPAVESGSVPAKSLAYAIGAFRLFGEAALDDTSSHDYNAELVKTLTPAMQSVVAGYGGALGHRLAADHDGAKVTINFLGKLQWADSVLGPWSDVTTKSPYSASATNLAKVYRAVE